jgi:RimJ/RimL family protein N-acetyltransferase
MTSIESDRLILRDLDEKDTEIFYNYRSDDDLLKYQNFRIKSLEESKRFIKEQRSFSIGQPNEWKQVGIALKNNQLIGDCAIQFSPEENRIAEIGCTISKDFHNKGYATEALKLLIQYTFDNHPIHKFKALVDIRNLPSQKMLLNVGFEKEAHFKKHYWDINDKEWMDELQYGLLRD